MEIFDLFQYRYLSLFPPFPNLLPWPLTSDYLGLASADFDTVIPPLLVFFFFLVWHPLHTRLPESG